MKMAMKILILLLFPTIILTGCWFIFIYPNIKEKRMIRMVQDEAMKGNPNALKMIKYKSCLRGERKEIIKEALKGNENALKILGY